MKKLNSLGKSTLNPFFTKIIFLISILYGEFVGHNVGWSEPMSKAPVVLVSINPVCCLVEELMRGIGKPVLLIPPLQSPHTYQFSARDRQLIESADYFVAVGAGLELFLEKITLPKNRLFIISSLKDLVLLEPRFSDQPCGHHHLTSKDPHLWLSPKNMLIFIQTFCAHLSKIDPKNAGHYASNCRLIEERLNELAQKIDTVLRGKNIRYMAFHDAYAYFDDAFGTQCVDIITSNPEHPELTPRKLQTLRQLSATHHLPIYVEPQFAEIPLKAIADFQQKNVVLDPYGIDTGQGMEGYCAMMENLADRLIVNKVT